MGREFMASAAPLDEGARAAVTGQAGLPTYTTAGAHHYLFVNGRPVRDRLLAGVVNGAYADLWRATVIRRLRCSFPATRVRRRQCASGQDRGPLPRCRSRPSLIVGSIRQAIAGAELRSMARLDDGHAARRDRWRRRQARCGTARARASTRQVGFAEEAEPFIGFEELCGDRGSAAGAARGELRRPSAAVLPGCSCTTWRSAQTGAGTATSMRMRRMKRANARKVEGEAVAARHCPSALAGARGGG